MPNLSDSCLVERVPASVRQLASSAGLGFPLSMREFINTDRSGQDYVLHIHLLFLDRPENTPGQPSVNAMLLAMRQIYRAAKIAVHVAHRHEMGSDPPMDVLRDIDIGECKGGETTDEQDTLFGYRGGAPKDHVVVYFVRMTNPSKNGCAASPEGKPGAVIAAPICSLWTLSHEVGHVLGATHPTDENCKVAPTILMTGCSTSNIVGTPTLRNEDIGIMRYLMDLLEM